MKPLLFLLLASLKIAAQEISQPPNLVEILYNERDPQAFESAHRAGTETGLSKQILIESRFLYIVDTGDHAAIAEFLPELEAQALVYSPDESMAFPVRENFYAIVEYARAVTALEKNDTSGFKKHITEAFWLSPAQSGFFGKLVDEVRLSSEMEKLVIDLKRTFTAQDPKQKSTPLAVHLGDAPAILLHFWSPWSRESIESMNDFYLSAATLKKNNIPSVSILPTSVPESQVEANDFIKDQKEKTSAPWLIDSPKNSLESAFRIQSFPSVVLLSKQGQVLFNGHPGNDLLWRELKKLAPSLEQPDAPVRDDNPSAKEE